MGQNVRVDLSSRRRVFEISVEIMSEFWIVQIMPTEDYGAWFQFDLARFLAKPALDSEVRTYIFLNFIKIQALKA